MPTVRYIARPGLKPSYHQGVTLIELMIALAILAILVAIAAPSFRDTIARSRVQSAVADLSASFSLARSEAIRTGIQTVVCPSVDLTSCSLAAVADWSTGWIVLADANRNGAVDTGETILQANTQLPAGIVIESLLAAPAVAFRGQGFSMNTGSLLVCPQNTPAAAQAVLLTRTGVRSVQRDASGNLRDATNQVVECS